MTHESKGCVVVLVVIVFYCLGFALTMAAFTDWIDQRIAAAKGNP